jgi:hypothetical protein
MDNIQSGGMYGVLAIPTPETPQRIDHGGL